MTANSFASSVMIVLACSTALPLPLACAPLPKPVGPTPISAIPPGTPSNGQPTQSKNAAPRDVQRPVIALDDAEDADAHGNQARRESTVVDTEPPPSGRPRATAPEVRLPAISRAELHRYLARGPQEFIGQVTVRPALQAHQRFLGWRIIDYRAPGPIFRDDIIMRVNGMSIERPEEFMKVWKVLASATRLEVALLRDGRRVRLVFPIAKP